MIHNLTALHPRFMLCPLSPHVEVGSRTPRKGEKSPLPLVVFFRPQFLIGMELIRAKFIMVDCLRETLKSFARSFAGSTNLIQPTAMLFVPTGGGKFTLQRNTAMSHHQTIPTPDAYSVIRATGEQPPRGFKQVCLCGFDRFNGAFNYCPKCGNPAPSHSRYERKNGGV